MSGQLRQPDPPLLVREYIQGVALCMCGCGEPAPLMKVNHAGSHMVKGKPYRFRRHHYKGRVADTPEERTAAFWAKVEGGGPGEPEECWTWIGALRSPGYPCFWDERAQGGHRMSYEMHVGPIPAGYTIDHLCRNIVCVNPAHLEPVPMRVNNERSNSASAKNTRKSYCKRGHAFTTENTIRTATGRQCRECRNMRQREGYARRRLGLELAAGTVSSGEAAKILGVHRNTLLLWVQAGHIEPVECDHRFTRFDPTTLKRPDTLGPYNRKPQADERETR